MDPYIKERCQELYEELNDSEKLGIKIGLFPVRLEEQFREIGITAVELISFSEEAECKSEHEVTNEEE
jgi:hypothetical protein